MSTRKFNHGDKEVRLRRRLEHLGSGEAHCLLGHKVSPHALELHHVAGREYDDETIILCANHHDPITDAQKDHPNRIPDCINPLEAWGHILLGLDEIIVVVREDLSDHPLRELLTFLHETLQTLGMRLIELARANPSESFGVVS